MPTKQIILCLSLVLLSLADLTSVSAQELAERTITDDRGKPISFASPPTRIVSLLPSLTETVCALGACDRLVGTDRFSNWPMHVSNLPKLGGLQDVQVERLYALNPDLVLLATSHRVIDRLESLGLTVVALESRSLDDIERVTNILGSVLELESEANAMLASTQLKVSNAAELVSTQWQDARVYFEIASDPFAAGEISFIGELLSALGLNNIVPSTLGPFPKLNPEFIVRENPDIILGSETAIDSMSTRPGWNTLDALKNQHTCGFKIEQFDVIARPGPRLGEAAVHIAQCISNLPPGKQTQ